VARLFGGQKKGTCWGEKKILSHQRKEGRSRGGRWEWNFFTDKLRKKNCSGKGRPKTLVSKKEEGNLEGGTGQNLL